MKTYRHVCTTCKWSAVCLFGENLFWFCFCPVCNRIYGRFLLVDGSISPRVYLARSCPEVAYYSEALQEILCGACYTVRHKDRRARNEE